MSVLSFFKKGAGGNDGAKTRRLILDGTSLAGVSNGGTVRPPDQLQILDRFGQFARREKIPAMVLFAGKALRELDDEGLYRDVAVVNVDRIEDLPAALRKTLRKQDCATTVVVTGSPDLATVAEAMRATVIRETTFRKVVDRMPGERGGNGGRSSRNRGGNNGGQKKQAPQPKAEKPANEDNNAKRDAEKSNGGIDDLIDLV